ncbi:MAG: SCP-like extracellular [Sphingomonadales bacterium]|nr:SCP-like extracellular [Sphingomonadales bacterium]
MMTAMLKAHNDARAEVGLPAVEWDAGLSAEALAYAQQLVANGRFEHSSGASRPNQGENLWAGTAGAFSFAQMAAGWVDEKRFFVAGIFPDVSSTGRWQDVGHYTQIIWRGTTKIGCGIASNNARDVLVCRYSPPGNFIGQRVF